VGASPRRRSGIVLRSQRRRRLLANPIAFWLEATGRRVAAIVGGVLAVVGCAALARVK